MINIALLLCGMCHWQRRVAAGNPPPIFRLSRARLDVIAGVGVDRAGWFVLCCVVVRRGDIGPWSGVGRDWRPCGYGQKPVRLWRLGPGVT